ncbi:MAG: methyl-accepting chemotaxis protein [Bacillota bacterium]|nr:methyl-accepting chemotaxis protein [Bacillota bacterium]
MKKLTLSSISSKLLLFITIIIVVISGSIGVISYNITKDNLVSNGKADLKYIVSTAIPTLDMLNKQVELGNLTLQDAQDQARKMFLGPKMEQGDKMSYDFSKSFFKYKQNGYLFAYDEKGRITMHPTIPVGTDKFNTKNDEGVYVIQGVLKAAHAKTLDGHYFTYMWKNPGESNEKEKISYVVDYKPWGWSVGVGAYTEEFYSALNSIKILITLISVGIAVISLLAFYFMTKRKMKLLSEVSNASLKIARGELDLVELPESKDEIGQLAASFNLMSKELRELMMKLKETSSHLIGSSSDLAAIAEESTASSEEIGKAMSEIATSTVSQSENIEKTNKRVELLSESIKKMNRENSAILDITNTSLTATERGSAMVSSLKKANTDTEKAIDKISLGITNLYMKIKDISHITETIQQITQQTNLLALNASIEAARAGEYGKGFAVVAEEVRKLAEGSNAATKKIQEMIEGIEKETESTVMYMSDTTTLSIQLNESVNNTEAEFTKIGQAVSMTMEAVKALSNEIASVTTQNNEITEFMGHISAISQETAAGSEEVTASVDEQVKAVLTVSQSADGLMGLSEQLNSVIEKYRFS